MFTLISKTPAARMAERRMRVLFSHLKDGQKTRAFSSSSARTSAVNSDKFEYTLDNPLLNKAQRTFYEENGFLVMKNLFPSEMLDKFRTRFLDIIEGRDGYASIKMKDVALKDIENASAERIYNKIQDFAWDEVLEEYLTHPKLVDYVSCFTGSNIMAIHTMLINKPPDPGTRSSRHPMHQDLYYFPFRPANRIVCAWTAMEKIDERNGCLFVVPGSHRKELLRHEYPEWEGGVNKFYHGIRDVDHLPKTMLLMEKGDTVFFHPVLFHGSGDNKTNNFRKAISCHYASSDCEFIEVVGTIQENIAKEVEEIAKKKNLGSVTYEDVWRNKSRCVRGYEWK